MNERWRALDVFRGLSVAGMILVNNPGSWSHVYPPLTHAEWHGWTPRRGGSPQACCSALGLFLRSGHSERSEESGGDTS